MAKDDLSVERLREILHYNEITGDLTWISQEPKHRRLLGHRVSRKVTGGYIACKIDGKSYVAHRLAWLYVHGEWPSKWVDHINGQKDDNRLVNLRPCTPSENQQNLSGKDGRLGTRWHPKAKRWFAAIKINGGLRHLGSFLTQADAHVAYLSAKQQLHTFNPQPR